MSFLRKQFGFWRIFLYFLIFTAFYAVLIFKFLLSNFTLPTGVGVLSNAALFSYTVFYSGGIFLLIYFMLIWGISTGFILGLCQFRRSVKGVLSATFIGTLIAGVSFYVILNDISLYFCLFHGALTAIFGLIAFPNKAGILLESQIIFKMFPKAVSTGANLTNQVIEKKRLCILPLVNSSCVYFDWNRYFWNYVHIISRSYRYSKYRSVNALDDDYCCVADVTYRTYHHVQTIPQEFSRHCFQRSYRCSLLQFGCSCI